MNILKGRGSREKNETKYQKYFKSSRFALKGQWFLVSAVIASGAFLAISILFNNYFVVDTSDTALIDEDYYFARVQSGMDETIQLSSCANMTRDIDNFVYFSKQEMAKIGYFLHVEYNIVNCASKTVNYGMLLASERYTRCYNVANPQAVLPGVKC